MDITDKFLLKKRTLIETVNDQLTNTFIRHRSINNFFVNLFAGYVYLPK